MVTHHGEIGDRREDVGEHEEVLDSVERRDWEAVLRRVSWCDAVEERTPS